MLQSENDELIPRCAPKPLPSDVTTAECRPSVPEISIVFTQKQPEQLSCSPSSVITSYSVWKNKCIPSVSYPPETDSLYNELSSTSKRSNVYPLRTGGPVIPAINNTSEYIPLNKPEYLDRTAKHTESLLQTPYFIEAQTVKCIPRGVLAIQQKKYQTNSLKNLEENGLLTSVGTQTDNFYNGDNEPDISTLATKDDIAEIKTMILKMETEHRHLLKTLQSLLKDKFDSERNKPKFRDIGVQNVDFTDGILIEEPLDMKCNLKEGDLTNYQLSKVQTSCANDMPQIQKTATEQSIVMNELAVKYLHNIKLNDMLEEFPKEKRLQNLCELPSKTIDNLNKNSTDLSTASYKYLRKYRLLPEENNNLSPHNDFPKLKSEEKLENLLDLEIIRCKPKFL